MNKDDSNALSPYYVTYRNGAPNSLLLGVTKNVRNIEITILKLRSLFLVFFIKSPFLYSPINIFRKTERNVKY